MISIIIASVRADFLTNIIQNIKETIGVDYEIISFNNSLGEKGLCELYNLGTEAAKYEILCFMHEDIELRTQNWGKKVIDIFNEQHNLGLLGVAGSQYKTLAPSGWHVSGLQAERSNLIQQFKFQQKEENHHQINPNNKSLEKVAVLDGVWFCTKKCIATETKFDENMLKGFHGYDIDFSLHVGVKHDILVTYDILLKHFSEGNFSKEWLGETLKVNNKWNEVLPVNTGEFSKKQLKKAERSTFKAFIKKMKTYNLKPSAVSELLWDNKMIKQLGLFNFLRVYLFLLKKIIF